MLGTEKMAIDPCKKYVLHSGYINSRNDGDRHLITAKQLLSLYGLKKDQCLLVNKPIEEMHPAEKQSYEYTVANYRLILLFPEFCGNYKEVLEKKEKEFNDRIFDKYRNNESIL